MRCEAGGKRRLGGFLCWFSFLFVFFDTPPAKKCRFFDWRRWAVLAFFCRLEVDLGNLGLRQAKMAEKKLET